MTWTQISPTVGASPHFETLAQIVGGDMDTDITDFAMIPETDLQMAVDAVTADSRQLTPLEKGALIKLVRRVFVLAEATPPSLGASVPAPLHAAAAPPSTPKVSTKQPEPGEELLDLNRFRICEVLDQSIRAIVQTLPPDKVTKYRQRYKAVVGFDPPPAERPTPEQLTALLAVLRACRAPYADFGVFGPFGNRILRSQRSAGQVFVQGVLQNRTFSGPDSYEAWLHCWAIFVVSMISLGYTSLGALNFYASGIKELNTLYPDKWPIIYQADVVMRSEQWAIFMERYRESPPADFEPERPWNTVIRNSSFAGESSPSGHWWFVHVVAPCSRASVPAAERTAAALEESGLSAGMASLSGPGSSRRSQQHGQHLSHPPQQHQLLHQHLPQPPPHPSARRERTPPPKRVCHNWNRGSGKCAKDRKGQCPGNRDHKCSVCGAGHRAHVAHGQDAADRAAKAENVGAGAASASRAGR